jgi:hypothetical protein
MQRPNFTFINYRGAKQWRNMTRGLPSTGSLHISKPQQSVAIRIRKASFPATKANKPMDVPSAAAPPLQMETSWWLYQLNTQSVNQQTIPFSNLKNSLTAFWDTKPNVPAVSALNVLTNAKCNIIKQCRSFIFIKRMEMLILMDNLEMLILMDNFVS